MNATANPKEARIPSAEGAGLGANALHDTGGSRQDEPSGFWFRHSCRLRVFGFWISGAAISALVLLATTPARAQYPRISSAVAAESAVRMAAADRRSDEAFAKALPVIKQWEAKGKPYLPGAAEPKDLPQAKIPAFPGAWGGGMYAFGGRGGKVLVVTNLADRGPGTFREACEAGGPRIVVFNVAGIIGLKERIRIRAPYITLAGSTCPSTLFRSD